MFALASVSAPRIVVANGTVAVTRRTQFRKLFWTPSAPLVHQGYLYALALAQHKYGIAIHHGQVLGTHTHWTFTPTEANLPEVLRYLHRESARFLQELLLAHGYDAPENVWDRRGPHVMRLVDAEAQLGWLLYSHLNCVAAGLVERVSDYPGFASDFGLMKNGVCPVSRPPLYYGKDGPREIELKYTAAPPMARAFGGDVDALVYYLERAARDMEDAYRDERRAKGERVLGAAAVRRIHPWAEPRTPRERRGQPVPTFRVGGASNEERRELETRCRSERKGFVAEHRECLELWRDGQRDVAFPAGTYKMRVEHSADVAAPLPDAILCVGDREEAPAIRTEERRDVMEQVGAAVRAAAAETVEDLRDVTIEGEPARDEASAADESGAPGRVRPAPQATGLVPPASTGTRTHASRLVTLRTRRDRAPP